ncbi:MFS transporter [Halosolutus gelatinilyticus]|uniref:MFS transporter n=1 Tax=Halosolutus gelatinilyticus TaxID=2931975 RepID=UPI001FF49E6A|nr:MFS transporter [Halosolutus gelatinilyticus]
MDPDGETVRRSSDSSRPSDVIGGGWRDVYRGWHVVAGGFVGAFVVFGLSYAFGVFLEPIQRDLALSRSGVSFVFSLQTVVIYLAAAALGVLADRFGVRRLLLFGAVALALGGVWTSRAETYAELLAAYGVVTAIGLGAIYVVSYATVPRWFERRRGLATGIATAGLGIGMVATAPAASALVGTAGWRDAILVLVVGAAIAIVLVAPLFADDPAAAGVDPGNEFPAGPPDRDPPDWAAYRRELTAVATSRLFLLVFAGWVTVYATLYVVLVHVVPYAGEAGLGEGAGAVAIALIGITTAAARIGVGGLADRLGRIETFVACSAVMGATTLALPIVDSAIGLYAFAVAFGIAYGGNGALLSPLTVDLFGAGNPNAVFGLVSLSFAVSGLTAPWLAGLTFDLAGTYAPAFVGAGIAGLCGAGLIAIAVRDA